VSFLITKRRGQVVNTLLRIWEIRVQIWVRRPAH
jgi:hypothetical protein